MTPVKVRALVLGSEHVGAGQEVKAGQGALLHADAGQVRVRHQDASEGAFAFGIQLRPYKTFRVGQGSANMARIRRGRGTDLGETKMPRCPGTADRSSDVAGARP